jgi:hypothetical protein
VSTDKDALRRHHHLASLYAGRGGARRPPAQTPCGGTDNRPPPTQGKWESDRQATAETVASPRLPRRGAVTAEQESRITMSFRSGH